MKMHDQGVYRQNILLVIGNEEDPEYQRACMQHGVHASSSIVISSLPISPASAYP